jgi:hypothetical protein
MAHEGPPAGSVTRPRAPTPAFSPPPLRVYQRAEIFESIRRYQSCCHQLPQRVLDFSGQAMSGPNQITEKRSSPPMEFGECFARGVRETQAFGLSFRMRRR